MPDVGVLTEQGFPVEDAGLGFKPVKEDGFDPFNDKKPEGQDSPKSQRDVG